MALQWTTETLRLSLFLKENAKLSVADWKAITSQDEPQTMQTLATRKSFIGPFQGGVLNVSVLGSRIDAVVLPKSPTETIEEGYVPTIGPWPGGCTDYVKATSPWLATLDYPIHRIAFSGTLLAKADSVQDAYAGLLSLLKSVKGDPERMRELVYRVSWPQKSKVIAGVTLHRITTWAALQIQLQLVIQTGMKSTTTETEATQVIRFEFDHSTDSERMDPFDRAQLVPIYDELVALASENAEQGEVL
jgi:hypothetical protein